MKKILVILIILMAAAGSAFAASDSAAHDVTITVDEVVLLELNDTSTITLATTSPGAGNAGDPVVGETDTSKRLYYTSLVATGTTRTIQASVSAAIMSGLALQLTATPSAASEGTTAGAVTLTTSDQDIVTNIGSCATGNTASDGTSLSYTLAVTDATALVVSAGQTVTVTLTLTDSL